MALGISSAMADIDPIMLEYAWPPWQTASLMFSCGAMWKGATESAAESTESQERDAMGLLVWLA